MSMVPEGAARPQDHLPPAVAPVVTDDELLRDLPELTPPGKLRLRTRNKIMKMAIGLREFIPSDAEEGVAVEIDTDDLEPETMEKFLDVLADVDDFAESIAVDKDAYVKWAEGATYDQFTALLTRYSSAVGESTGSSN